MHKTNVFIFIVMCCILIGYSPDKTIAMQIEPKGEAKMVSINDTHPRDEGGTINPSFYISHAQALTTPIWRTRIDDIPYTMTFSNLSRKWINVNIYKGDKVDRTQTVFEGDTEMEEFSTFGHVVQIVPYEKGKEFLSSYPYMVVTRDGYGVVHISMQKRSYNESLPGNTFRKLSEKITGTSTQSDIIKWGSVKEVNPDELQYLTLTRSQPAGTGIEYVAKVEPEGIIKQTINTVNYKNPNLPGSSGEHKWRWQALQDGLVTITISQLGLQPMYSDSTVYHYEIKNGMFSLIKTSDSQPMQAMMGQQASKQTVNSDTTASQTAWTCSCGTTNNNKFCTECGKPRP